MKNLKVSTSIHRQLTDLAESIGVTPEKAIGLLVGTQLRERPSASKTGLLHAPVRQKPIPSQMHDLIFDVAKQVYIDGTMTLEQANTKLRSKMNGGSAAVRIQLVKNLLEGRTFRATSGSQCVQFFLKRILDDFGAERCRKALKALKANIEHLQSRGLRAKRLEAVYKEYTALV